MQFVQIVLSWGENDWFCANEVFFFRAQKIVCIDRFPHLGFCLRLSQIMEPARKPLRISKVQMGVPSGTLLHRVHACLWSRHEVGVAG